MSIRFLSECRDTKVELEGAWARIWYFGMRSLHSASVGNTYCRRGVAGPRADRARLGAAARASRLRSGSAQRRGTLEKHRVLSNFFTFEVREISKPLIFIGGMNYANL